MAGGDPETAMTVREAAVADTVGEILEREDRVVIAAHNAHVQRTPVRLPGVPAYPSMGVRLHDGLGDAYRVIGLTNGSGRTLNTGPGFQQGEIFAALPAPEPGTLDALLHARGGGRLVAVTALHALERTTAQRFGLGTVEIDPVAAFDAVIHLPHVTAAIPDAAALAASPAEVRRLRDAR